MGCISDFILDGDAFGRTACAFAISTGLNPICTSILAWLCLVQWTVIFFNYRKAILGQEVAVTAGNYMSNRVAKSLEQVLKQIENGDTKDEKILLELVKQLLEVGQNRNASAVS